MHAHTSSFNNKLWLTLNDLILVMWWKSWNQKPPNIHVKRGGITLHVRILAFLKFLFTHQ